MKRHNILPRVFAQIWRRFFYFAANWEAARNSQQIQPFFHWVCGCLQPGRGFNYLQLCTQGALSFMQRLRVCFIFLTSGVGSYWERVKRHSCCYAPAAVLLVVRTRGLIISLLWNESSAAALIRRPKWSYFHWFNFPVRSRKSSRWPVKSLWNRTISCGKNTVDRATVTSPGGLWRTRMNVLLGGSALVC